MPNEKKSAKHTEMTREAAKAFLETNQVKFVLAQFVDIHGVAKTKAVPVEHFEDIILEDGAGFAGFAVWGMGQEPQDPDYMAMGVAGSRASRGRSTAAMCSRNRSDA